MVGKRQLSFAIRTVLTRLRFQPSRWGTLLPDPMAPDGKNALCRSVPVLKWGLEGSHFPQQCQQPPRSYQRALRSPCDAAHGHLA
jgi:hypothetical protein